MSTNPRDISGSRRLLTSPGVETFLIFIQGVELREFCGFDLYRQEDELERAEAALIAPTADAALATGHDLLLDALVWRAHADYVHALGHPDAAVEQINHRAVRYTREAIARWREATPGSDRISVFVNGDIGPRGDGYRYDGGVTADTAHAYHRRQIEALADAGADVVSALTMTNVAETVAIARASREVGLPCIVSPTVETDGRTPEGLSLGDFINNVERETGAGPLFYMVNCAHPAHLEPALRRAADRDEPWLHRLRGLRANASQKSHGELDNSTELDRGNPTGLAADLARLYRDFSFHLAGGCCGTDVEHLTHIAHAVAGRNAVRAA
jgi:homocysteine S-methyltransferase